MADDFYIDGRDHLYTLCKALQALYEGRIIKYRIDDPWQIVEAVPNKRHIRCYKLILNMPPQHGKSRTLILFNQWVFGKNTDEKIICASYNDDAAMDFSRYTRDGIADKDRISEDEILYCDIFKNVRIKDGNASYGKWALAGQFFSYKGCGIEGSITGKGGTVRIVDDPIKDAAVAFNDAELDKIWIWYTATFLSRSAKGIPIDIMNHTRWSTKDPCGRILASAKAKDWYILKMEAYDKTTNKTLCEELLPLERYMELRDIAEAEGGVVEAVFRGNYHQEPLDLVGKLYSIKTYVTLPELEQIISYTDTADEGKDWLSCFIAGVYKGDLYVLDAYYTQSPMEVTEVETAKRLVEFQVNRAKIESNNGGRGFARNVQRISREQFKKEIQIEWFHQGENKMARIITQSSFVNNHIFFPEGWMGLWPELYKHLNGFQKEKNNKTDDGADALTGLAEMVNVPNGFAGSFAFMQMELEKRKKRG